MALPELQKLSTTLLMKYYLKKKPNRNWKALKKVKVSELGAVNVMTGIYTGRSPKDKYIVMMRTPRYSMVDNRRIQKR